MLILIIKAIQTLRLKIIFTFFILFNCYFLVAQDTIKSKEETKQYSKIELYSKKHKFTKFIYKLIFEPVSKPKIAMNSFHKIKKMNFVSFEGKIIRKIKITTLDPFGYSVNDTAATPKKFLLKAGNSLHIKTKNFAIKNVLLINENTPLDSLLVKESERLIRGQRYVSQVVMETKLVSKDSVDISIRVLDSWSSVPEFNISNNKSSFSLTEKNFFGTGHEFSNTYIKNFTGIQDGYNFSYTIPNIDNTFIKTSLGYTIDFDKNYTKLINIERPFYSPFAHWAAGILFSQHYGSELTTTVNQNLELQRFKANSHDYWGGHSFQIFKGNSEYQRTTNFISTARFFSKNYVEKPLIGKDSLGVYSNENLYLVGLGISSRKYIQDKYIFNFNIVEDIPTGFSYLLTGGFQNKNNLNRFYIGGKAVLGNYFDFGYLSTNFEYGTFYNNGKSEESAAVFQAVYFTNLKEIRTWKFRQFIKPELVIGMNRPNTISDRITLNGDSGINGFNSETLFGTKKLLVTFQTQAYSNWKVSGFRLNPYFSYTMGILNKEGENFGSGKLYSQIGFGIIISNDYLVFKSFQFSFSLYPNLPTDGGSFFKTNAISTSDFGLQNFEISKPELVKYK